MLQSVLQLTKEQSVTVRSAADRKEQSVTVRSAADRKEQSVTARCDGEPSVLAGLPARAGCTERTRKPQAGCRNALTNEAAARMTGRGSLQLTVTDAGRPKAERSARAVQSLRV